MDNKVTLMKNMGSFFKPDFEAVAKASHDVRADIILKNEMIKEAKQDNQPTVITSHFTDVGSKVQVYHADSLDLSDLKVGDKVYPVDSEGRRGISETVIYVDDK